MELRPLGAGFHLKDLLLLRQPSKVLYFARDLNIYEIFDLARRHRGQQMQCEARGGQAAEQRLPELTSAAQPVVECTEWQRPASGSCSSPGALGGMPGADPAGSQCGYGS